VIAAGLFIFATVAKRMISMVVVNRIRRRQRHLFLSPARQCPRGCEDHVRLPEGVLEMPDHPRADALCRDVNRCVN